MQKKRGETHIEHREKSFAILVLFHLCIIFNAIVLCFTLSSPSSFFHIYIHYLLLLLLFLVFIRSFFPALSLKLEILFCTPIDTHYVPVHITLFFFFSSPLFSFFLNFFFFSFVQQINTRRNY